MRVVQQAKSSCDVKIGNKQGLKAGNDVLLDNIFDILARMNLKFCIYMELQTAYRAIGMIQGDFYERYNFYMDSCAISLSPFLF